MTILITGATDGLGKALAKDLAAEGHQLLLHGRNREKGAALLQELGAAEASRHFYYNADFAELGQVVAMARQLMQDHEQIDLIINNAAIGGGPRDRAGRQESADGIELRFQVNHLSHFLLNQELLPLVRSSSFKKIIHVASIGQAPLDLEDYNYEKNYDSFTAYCRSKLAQIIYCFEMAERYPDLFVNALHPATLMDTNMVRDHFGKTMATVADGVEAVKYVAFGKDTGNVSGKYFNRLRMEQAHAQAYDPEIRKQLWALSSRLCGFNS